MRTLTAQDQAILERNGSQADFYRVVALGPSGVNWYDLAAFYGRNLVQSVNCKGDNDTELSTATVYLSRASDGEVTPGFSLAPEMSGSIPNELDGGPALLIPNTRIRIYTQTQPAGFPGPDPNAWQLLFDGAIDQLDSGPDPMELQCSDLAVRLQRAFIKNERGYGVWQPGQRYIGNATLGAVILPPQNDPTFPNNADAPTGPWLMCTGATGVAGANNWASGISTPNGTVRTPTIPNGFTYVSSGGTHLTGATEPTWPQQPGLTVTDNGITWTCTQPTPPVWPNTVGVTVSDNGLTWKCVVAAGGAPTATAMETQIQMLLDDNLGVGAWTLSTPSPSSEVIRPYTQSCQNLLEAIHTLGQIIGWDVRLKWDSGSSQFKLVLFDVNRSASSPVISYQTQRVIDINEVQHNLDNVRNDVDVWFWDGVNVDVKGNPVLTRVNWKDNTSITKYGDLYCSVTEGAGMAINTAAAALKMAKAIVSDLGQEPIEVTVVMPFSWWQELNDFITVSADDIRFKNGQNLAVFAIEHQLSQQGQAGTTTLTLRGKPSLGVTKWASVFAVPGSNGVVKQLNPNVAMTPGTVAATLGGGRITWKMPSSMRRRYKSTDVYISTTNGFIPGSSNYVETVTGTEYTPAHLSPGTTYYCRVAHRDTNDNPTPPSPQMSFVAGFGNALISTTFKVAIPTAAKLAPGARPNLSAATFDPSGIVGTTLANTITPATNLWLDIHARMRFTTGDSTMGVGARAKLYLWDETASAAICASEWFQAGVDTSGNPDLVAVMRETVKLLAAHNYSVRYLAQNADGSTTVTWGIVAANLGSSPYDSGAFIEALPIPFNN